MPRLGNLLWALKLLQQCENFLGVIVLRSVGHLLSGSMVEVMASSPKRTYATCPTSQVCCSQSPCPRDRPLLTRASAGDAETLKGRSGSVSCGVSGSWCTQGFVCALQESVFPILWKFCNQIPMAFKSNSLGVLSPFARSPSWEICCVP